VSRDRQNPAVPSADDFQSWRDYAISNRERITHLEHELERVRQAQHDMRAEVVAIGYLAKEVHRVAESVESLGSRVDTIGKRVLNRPTVPVLAVFAQYVSVIVAVVALIVAATR